MNALFVLVTMSVPAPLLFKFPPVAPPAMVGLNNWQPSVSVVPDATLKPPPFTSSKTPRLALVKLIVAVVVSVPRFIESWLVVNVAGFAPRRASESIVNPPAAPAPSPITVPPVKLLLLPVSVT